MWHQMAYNVAEKLHLRPLDIMMNWSCEEVLVAFGFYGNQRMRENYEDYKNLDSDSKKKAGVAPKKYLVEFITFEQLSKLNAPKTQKEIQEEERQRAIVEQFMKGGGKLG